MFILSTQRTLDNLQCFEKYTNYLYSQQHIFPKSAYALATAEWYANFNDHKCPHDAWLENITIEEIISDDVSDRHTAITIRLLGAYHDGYIELFYPKVFSYHLTSSNALHGHRDWRYDEFRVNPQGHLIHEIEWYDITETSRWLIEASDIEYRWIPIAES